MWYDYLDRNVTLVTLKNRAVEIAEVASSVTRNDLTLGFREPTVLTVLKSLKSI